MSEKVEVDKDEYDWLVWFASNADFGPANGDVQYIMRENYEERTGRKVPKEWKYE